MKPNADEPAAQSGDEQVEEQLCHEEAGHGEPPPERSYTPLPPPVLRKPPRTLPILVVVLIIFIIAAVLNHYFGPGSELLPFKDHLADYASTKGYIEKPGPPPAVVGKVMIIDADNAQIDASTFRLPDGLRPHRDSEVGTIVLFKRLKDKEIGEYTIGQYAFAQVWRLILLDRTTHTMYPRWTDVMGTSPRQAVQERERSQRGGPATDAMLQAISNLPKK